MPKICKQYLLPFHYKVKQNYLKSRSLFAIPPDLLYTHVNDYIVKYQKHYHKNKSKCLFIFFKLKKITTNEILLLSLQNLATHVSVIFYFLSFAKFAFS